MHRLGIYSKLIIAAAMLFGLLLNIGAILPEGKETLTVPVDKSFNGEKFNYQMTLDRKTSFYSVYYLKYPAPTDSSKGNPFGDIYAYYYLPSDIKPDSKPRPAVVCLHILGGNGALTNMFCAHLASNGIPAIMCILPLFGERCPEGSRRAMLKRPDGARLLGEALREGPLDAMRTVDVMLTRPEVNPEKINLLGTSLGGITGATATGMDDRIDKAVILLAGGDVNKIIGFSRETREMRSIIDNAMPVDKRFLTDVLAEVEPLKYAAQLKRRADQNKLIMFNAAEDEVVPPECTMRLARECGMQDKIKILPGLGHYTAIAALPQIMTDLVAFFRDDSVPARKPQVNGNPETEIVRQVFGQLETLARFTPQPGQCYFVDASFEVRDAKDKPSASGRVTVVRGNGKHFKLDLKVDKSPLKDKLHDLSLGFGDYPWIVSGKGTVYCGQLNRDGNSSPDKYFSPVILSVRQMLCGVLALAANGSLEPLSKWIKVSLEKSGDGKYFLLLKERNFTAEIYLKDNTTVPEKILFRDKRNTGMIKFHHWQLGAPAQSELFDSPAKAKTVMVEQKDLDRMVASIVNFLAEGA